MNALLAMTCLLNSLLPCTLLAASVDKDAAAVAAAVAPVAVDQGVELVTVNYDLARVWTSPAADQYALRTIPLRFVQEDWEPTIGEDEQWFPLDELNDFLWNVVAPGEFDYEGRVLDAVGPYTLRITAPASVQADVRSTLDFLAAAAQRRARVDIDLWRMTGDGVLPDPVDAASLAEAEAAGHLLRLAGRREELQLGRTERRDALTQTRYLRDWDAEIAQLAAIGQPQFDTLQTGTTLLLRLEAQGERQVTLRFVEQLSELRGMEHRSDALRATTHNDSGNSTDVVGGALDQPVVAFATLAGSAVLGVGEELVTIAHAQTLDGPVGYVVRYRLVSVDPAPAPLLLAGTPTRDVRALDISPAMWPGLDAAAPTPQQYAPGGDPHGEPRPWLVFPATERRETGDVVQAVLDVGNMTDGEAPGRAAWSLGSHTILGGNPVVTESMQTALALQLPTRRSLSLQLLLIEGGRASPGRTVATTTLPLCTGDTGVVVVGCARTLVTGYDVDVAQGASVPDPIVGGCLDGFALRARASDDGSVALDLLSLRALRRDRLDLRVPGLMPVDNVDLALASLSPRLVPDGLWHSQPDIAGGFDGTQLELRWRLVAP